MAAAGSSLPDFGKNNGTADDVNNSMYIGSADVGNTKSPNYKLLLFVNGGPARFAAWLPDQFELTVGSEWAPAQAASSLNDMGGKFNDLTQVAAGGATWKSQVLSTQFWQGSSKIHFDIPVQLRAINDTAEIKSQLGVLLALSLPTLSKFGTFVAPSYSTIKGVGDAALDVAQGAAAQMAGNFSGATTKYKDTLKAMEVASDKKIDIAIGNFLLIQDVVMTGFRMAVPTRYDVQGQPLEMEITLSFETRKTPTAEDVAAWFTAGVQ